MSEHWTERLSDYLDGEMAGDERRRLEAHLEECPSCRGTLADLRAVVEVAEHLEDKAPARDLWPAILEELSRRGADVIDLAARTGRAAGLDSGAKRAGIRLTVPQMAAAAAALALFSGATAWALRGASGAGQAGPVPVVTSSPVQPASSEAESSYAEQLEELESILDGYRSVLSPNTVRILEKNLAVIDAAVAESRRALELDPENPYLESHLEGTLRRKVEFLREATATLQAAS